MHTLLIAIGVFVLVSVLSTTPQGRAAARERLRRYNPILLGVTAVLAIIILSGF